MSEGLKAARRARGELGDAVARRARELQQQSLGEGPWGRSKESNAVSQLAVLRRGVGTPAGSSPEIWDDTIGLVPETLLGMTDNPSPWEQAAHHAMTLFALHRQGRMKHAQRDGVAPGTAFATLARKRGDSDGDSAGVRRRFDAMVTATSPEESTYHLRGLVLLMHSDEVGMDYGQLAEDLAGLWTSRRDTVRLNWARQYRRLPPPSKPEEVSDTEPTTEEPA